MNEIEKLLEGCAVKVLEATRVGGAVRFRRLRKRRKMRQRSVGTSSCEEERWVNTNFKATDMSDVVSERRVLERARRKHKYDPRRELKRIKQFYKQHNPSKLDEIFLLVQQYQNHLDQVLRTLKEKYTSLPPIDNKRRLRLYLSYTCLDEEECVKFFSTYKQNEESPASAGHMIESVSCPTDRSEGARFLDGSEDVTQYRFTMGGGDEWLDNDSFRDIGSLTDDDLSVGAKTDDEMAAQVPPAATPKSAKPPTATPNSGNLNAGSVPNVTANGGGLSNHVNSSMSLPTHGQPFNWQAVSPQQRAHSPPRVHDHGLPPKSPNHHRKPIGFASQKPPPPFPDDNNPLTPPAKAKAMGKRLNSSADSYAVDLERRDRHHAARGFGGVYRNRRSRINWLDGESVLKSVDCKVPVPSIKQHVSARFLVSNYRIGLKLVGCLIPRAISIPLASIEKVRHRTKQQDVQSAAPPPQQTTRRSPRGRPTSPNDQPEVRSRSPSPSVNATPAGNTTSNQYTSIDAIVQPVPYSETIDLPPPPPTPEPAEKPNGASPGTQRSSETPKQTQSSTKPQDKIGVLEIQTKGVACYYIYMKTEEIVAVTKLLHPLVACRKPVFCVSHKNSYKGTVHDEEGSHVVAQEFERMTRNCSPHIARHWRLSCVNQNYEAVPSYPEMVITPSCATDAVIKQVSNFRTKSRFPILSWLHPDTGAAICRSSQPKVGIGGKRSLYDEQYVAMLHTPPPDDDIGGKVTGTDSPQPEETVDKERINVVIVDCRPFANAVANRSRAGGYEDSRYYAGCSYYNADLGNIHEITRSLKLVRKMVDNPPPIGTNSWPQAIHETGWLKHLEKIIIASIRVVSVVESGTSVLVHCSDGWDRTSQVVSLAKLLIDPFYRTIEGFQVLLRNDWLAAGHKFADRHFNAESSMDKSEMSPIFLQWMDCVYQVWRTYPTQFEFSDQYLIYILHHSTSGRFKTFLHNSELERTTAATVGISLWAHLNSPEQRYHRPEFANILYSPKAAAVLKPDNWPRFLVFWEELHMQLDHEWTDLWTETVGEKLLSIGRELEDHRLKRPKMEAALKKKMGDLSSFSTVKHLVSLVDSKKNDVAWMKELLEDMVIQRVFDRIDFIEMHRSKHGGSISGMEYGFRNTTGPGSVLGPGGRWVPDNMAPCCMACLRPFQWWRRRHHCRLCGNVFCAMHSRRRCVLTDRPSAGQVRVCDDCAVQVGRDQQATPYASPLGNRSMESTPNLLPNDSNIHRSSSRRIGRSPQQRPQSPFVF